MLARLLLLYNDTVNIAANRCEQIQRKESERRAADEKAHQDEVRTSIYNYNNCTFNL
jgi:hypothetical protein